MKAHEIIATSPPELVAGMLRFFRDDERVAYKTALASLASQRKLRPVFVQKKPAEQQMAWMQDALGRRTGEAIAEQLLQVWLMKAHEPMLVAFLDGVGIGHDGKGAIDELPEQLDPGALGTALEKLEGEYPPELVLLYLRVFQLQREGGWAAVDEAIAARSAAADA